MGRETVADFLAGFVRPLVQGGEIKVGRPLRGETLQAFADELGYATEMVLGIDEARREVVSQLVVRPPELVFAEDELFLAAAVHNLLFLAHPRVEKWTVTDALVHRIGETAQYFASQPLNQSRSRILARYGLLHNLFAISRVDCTVSWWTGSRIFRGQKPPARLTAWRTVRRVQERIDKVTFADAMTRETIRAEAGPVIDVLLRRSPLNLLLGDPHFTPPVHWEDAVFILRDAELARAVAYHTLVPADPHELIAGPARFAAALEQMLERTPKESDVRAVVAFLVHLNALLALGEVRERPRETSSPLIGAVLAPEKTSERMRGLVTFFALPEALADIDQRLAEPPGLRQLEALFSRWRVHRAQVAQLVGQAAIQALAIRLRRHLAAAPRRDLWR